MASHNLDLEAFASSSLFPRLSSPLFSPALQARDGASQPYGTTRCFGRLLCTVFCSRVWGERPQEESVLHNSLAGGRLPAVVLW